MARTKVPGILEIKNFAAHLPVSALKNWLRFHDKPYSSKTEGEFFKNLNRWIADGRLIEQDIDNAVYDIEENGGKKIYLRILKGDFPKSRQEFERYVKKVSVPIVALTARSVRTSSRPVLNHILWEEDLKRTDAHIRIKYSELQEDVELDADSEEWNVVERLVFVSIDIEVGTGFTQVRLDPPAKRHTHKGADGRSSAKVYEQYYFDKVVELFPGTMLEYYALNSVADYIDKHGADIFRINREDSTVSGGKQIYSVVSGDVRQLPARLGAVAEDGDNWIFEDLTGYWIAKTSKGALFNDLFMRLSKSDSSIKFDRNCISLELNYAIGRIKEIRGKV